MLFQLLTISVCSIASAMGLPACKMVDGQISVVRPAWRLEAEHRCLQDRDSTALAGIKSTKAINESNGCGAAFPQLVSGLAFNSVRLSPPAQLVCPMVPAIDDWLAETVQPAAVTYLHTRIVGLKIAASYTCRTRNRKPGARMSEHAYLNAIDISAFETSDGREITVLDGWKVGGETSDFLRAVHKDACEHFTTVIGPDGDEHHQDHFHFDLIRRGNKGFSRYCK